MSRSYAGRSLPAQTTRPAQQRNAAKSSDSMTQQAHLRHERDVSPTRQIRRDGFTQFMPNMSTRQQMLSNAEKEERDYDAYKQDNRPHYNFCEAVGGGAPPQPNHLHSKTPTKTAQQRARMYREEERKRQMKECEEMKRKQREKTDRNTEKEKQKEQIQRRNHREVNNAFLDALEKKTSQSSKTSSNPASSSTETRN